jgi:hypothetical protein
MGPPVVRARCPGWLGEGGSSRWLRRRHTPEQIIRKLREADRLLAYLYRHAGRDHERRGRRRSDPTAPGPRAASRTCRATLRVGDLDFDENRVSVVRTVQGVSGRIRMVDATKSSASRRTMAAPTPLMQELPEHLDAFRPGAGSGDPRLRRRTRRHPSSQLLASVRKPAATRVGLAVGARRASTFMVSAASPPPSWSPAVSIPGSAGSSRAQHSGAHYRALRARPRRRRSCRRGSVGPAARRWGAFSDGERARITDAEGTTPEMTGGKRREIPGHSPSSPFRALRSHRRSRGFESHHLHQTRYVSAYRPRQFAVTAPASGLM